MPKLDRHLFICVNERPSGSPKGSCQHAGGERVAGRMKERLYELGLKRVVRANKSGCLGECARGVTMVVYPDQVWYGRVQEQDVDEIIEEHILGGRPVERLRIDDDQLLGRGLRACDVASPPGSGGTGGEVGRLETPERGTPATG